MQRKCNKCNRTKPIEDFHFKDKKRGVRNTICKSCSLEYSRKWYSKNKTWQKANAKRHSIATKHKHARKLYEYLTTHPCVDCGESDPLVLEFDHIQSKKNTVGEMVSAAYSWKRIVEEISKCEVRCANCHRRKTARDYGWLRYKFSKEIIQ